MKNKPQRNASGFTLLELLLSMTITAVIIAMVYGIFHVAVRAWERGERDIDSQQRLRAVSQLLMTQLRSIRMTRAIFQKDDQSVNFDGQPQRIAFVSAIALNPANRDHAVIVQYETESTEAGMVLYLLEQPLMPINDPIDLSAADGAATDGDERHVMLSGERSITFEYLSPDNDDEALVWDTVWQGTPENPWPIAVKIIIDPLRGEPVQMIVPLEGSQAI